MAMNRRAACCEKGHSGLYEVESELSPCPGSVINIPGTLAPKRPPTVFAFDGNQLGHPAGEYVPMGVRGPDAHAQGNL